MRDGRNLPSHVKLKPHVLKIDEVLSSDTGDYSCLAKDDYNYTHTAMSILLVGGKYKRNY